MLKTKIAAKLHFFFFKKKQPTGFTKQLHYKTKSGHQNGKNDEQNDD